MPPDVPLPSVQDAVMAEQSTLVDVNIENQDEDEHLPQMDPESNEEEDPLEDQENTPPDPVALQQENSAQVDPNGRIPGQKPLDPE